MKGKKNNNTSVVIKENIRRGLGLFGALSFRLVLGLALGLGSLVLFAKLVEDLLFNELLLFDQVATFIVRYNASPQLTEVMKDISNLGHPYLLAVVGLLAMVYTGVYRRHLWDTILVPLSLLGGVILNEALKLLFHRERPGLPHLVEAGGFSFPSGHSMMSLIFYGLMVYLMWVNLPGRLLRYPVAVMLSVLILAIGISRIYLGVHYPSDVAAGFAAGSFWLVACLLGLKGIRHYKDGS